MNPQADNVPVTSMTILQKRFIKETKLLKHKQKILMLFIKNI